MDNSALYGAAGDRFLDKSNKYFEILKENVEKMGSAEDYLDFVGLTMADATDYCIGRNSADSRYKKIARRLKRDANRIRQHYAIAPAWNERTTATKSMFFAKQVLWDGLRLSDQPEGAKRADIGITINFGAKNAFD